MRSWLLTEEGLRQLLQLSADGSDHEYIISHNLPEVALFMPAQKLTDIIDDPAPYPTVLSYNAEDFGAPRNVSVNGKKVAAVHKIEVQQADVEFNEVTLTIRGVVVNVNKE